MDNPATLLHSGFCARGFVAARYSAMDRCVRFSREAALQAMRLIENHVSANRHARDGEISPVTPMRMG
jgi:hypothetical protein